jgi:phosphate acyltransferase
VKFLGENLFLFPLKKTRKRSINIVRLKYILKSGEVKLRILVDAMGGNKAPKEIVNGCIDAVTQLKGFDILLIGDSKQIYKIIEKRRFNNKRIQVIHTKEVITNDDMPSRAIRRKKNSSIVVGFNMLKRGQGDVFLSAGSTGALLSGALLILGRLKGVDRPALGAIVPTQSGKALLIDAGLNSSCRPINYLQFGILGDIYMKNLYNIKNPSVGLLNVGSEPKKGTEIIKQAYTKLSKSELNFIGNIEGKDLPEGKVDIAVCDGFVGNILLKFLEGTGSYIFSALKGIYKRSIFSKLSALIVSKDMREFKNQLDTDENGGAPVLGVNGIVIKSHGSSNAKTIKFVIKRAYDFAKSSIMTEIKQKFDEMEVDNIDDK